MTLFTHFSRSKVIIIEIRNNELDVNKQKTVFGSLNS